MPKSNSQQKSTPDACTRRQQVGAERRGAGGIASGKDRPVLRAVGGSSFKLWESKEKLTCRKINRPEHTAGGSQNKGTEKLQRRAAPSPLEVGGRGRGKRQTQPQRSHPLPPGKQAPGPV